MIPLAERMNSLSGAIPDLEPVEHDVDPSMLAAVEAALLEGETHYTVRPGIPELRIEIAREIDRKGGPRPDAERPEDNVFITSADSESLFTILLGLGPAPGDALVSAPEPFPHTSLFHLMGLRTRDVGQAPRCRLIFRHCSTEQTVHERLLSIAADQDIPDILDLGPTLMASPSTPFPPFDPERTLIMGNLNNLAGLSSFRIAYVTGPGANLARCRPWKQALSICSAAPSQRAALHALAVSRREAR
jgi:aspartate/methionine/tyrosine aminotransferase